MERIKPKEGNEGYFDPSEDTVDPSIFRPLYELSLQLYFDEKSRFEKIDEKSSKYLNFIIFLIGVSGYLAQRSLELFPIKNTIDCVLLIYVGLFYIFLFRAFNQTFKALQLRNLEHIVITKQDYLYLKKYRRIDYCGYAKEISCITKKNTLATNKKASIIDDSYYSLKAALSCIILSYCIYLIRELVL